MVDMLVGMLGFPMSTSTRPLVVLIRVVIVGIGIAAPPIIAVGPPSTVIFCTMVTSACTTAEHTASTTSVADQRFMQSSKRNVNVGLLAAGVMTAAAQLRDVAGLLAVVAAVLPEL